MPPKPRITRSDILQAALTLIREQGDEALNARSLAAELKCSTQPIFSNFPTMEDLKAAVVQAAYGLYLDFLRAEAERGEFPAYKSFGMAYIRFAKEEKQLFKLLFMCDRRGRDFTPTEDFEASVDMIMAANGIPRETASLMHLEMWAAVHGIAAMLTTSFLDPDRELISTMLSDIYHGLRARHIPKEEQT
jgi:AcrR family transcriptional regulator